MTPATAAAVSLLERLRTLAETWNEPWVPGVCRVDTRPPSLAGQRAFEALRLTGYYSRPKEMVPCINDAIAALKGETT